MRVGQKGCLESWGPRQLPSEVISQIFPLPGQNEMHLQPTQRSLSVLLTSEYLLWVTLVQCNGLDRFLVLLGHLMVFSASSPFPTRIRHLKTETAQAEAAEALWESLNEKLIAHRMRSSRASIVLNMSVFASECVCVCKRLLASMKMHA